MPSSRSSLPALVTTLLFIVGILWSLLPGALHAQSDSANSSSVDSLIRTAKTLLDTGTDTGAIDSLKRARAVFKQAAGGAAHQGLSHYYAALANYRINNHLPDDAEKQREQVLQDASEHLQTATDLDENFADAWALLAGVYGQRIGLNPLTKGITLGPSADEAMQTAQELEPNNPRVWIISGTQDFFTPSMFGGDKQRALEKFEKAARLAERESVDDPLAPSWGHAEAYAWIGIAHMEAERPSAARTAFDRALEINPEYGWVKSVLLPELASREE